MAILDVARVDYTDLDFDALRSRAFNIISAVFPDWTEQSVANFGNLLVEMYCNIGDVLGFYLDNRARESRITQATQRKSVLDLAKLIGYTASGATAATVDVTLTLAAVPANDVPIPAGSIVRTESVTEPVLFQILDDVTIAASTDPPVATGVTVEHSTSHVENFPATGLPNQELRLGSTPFLDSSESISAANGAYTRVSNFLSSTSEDRHYTLTVDQRDKATVRFGSGTAGQVPSGTIAVTYKTGGGPEGNVEAAAIRRIEGAFTDELGNPVLVSVTNPLKASGGRARASVKTIQQQAPESLRTLTRTVAREDYEINAKRVAGVARALMLTSDEYDAVQENQGILYIVPSGGGEASTALKNAVTTMVTTTYPKTITFKPTVASAQYLDIDVYAVVYLRKGTVPATARAAISTALEEFFSVETTDASGETVPNTSIDFGYYMAQNSEGEFDGAIAFSDIYNVVRDVAGVRKIGDGSSEFLVNGSRADLSVAVYQFPRLGTVTLINGETGAAL